MQGWIPRVLTAFGLLRALFGFTNKIAAFLVRGLRSSKAQRVAPETQWPTRRQI
jgi:hypothetical protein